MRRLLTFTGLLVTLWAASVAAADKLYVFFVTTARPMTVQETIQQKTPGTEVLVFRRYIDFEERLALDSPDVVIAQPRLIRQLPSYRIRLQGVRNGKTEEPYVLVSEGSALSPSAMTPETVVGVIDFLGRGGMKTLLGTIFSPVPTPQRVSHIEDLLPLITYNMAQAVMLFEKDVPYVRQKSKMNLVITPLPNAREQILAVAVRNSSRSSGVVEKLKKIDPAALQIMGVDAWK
jgi:hypothetical protein